MNENSTTDYGNASNTGNKSSIVVGKRGTLRWSTSANTALKVSGLIDITDGGTWERGTTGTPIGSSYTSDLLLDTDATSGSGGFRVRLFSGGTLKEHGATKTPWTFLTETAAASQAVLKVASTTGWAVGDRLIIAGTRRNVNEVEDKVIQTVDSATQVTLTTNLTYPHNGGTEPNCEVLNLTRNVTTHGGSTGYGSCYECNSPTGVLDMRYMCLYNVNGTTNGRGGISVGPTTGSVYLYGLAMHSPSTNAIGVETYHASTTMNNFELRNCAFYQLGWRITNATNNTNIVLDSNAVVGYGLNLQIADVGGTITNNRVACSAASSSGFCVITDMGATIGTFSGNVAHTMYNCGFAIQAAVNGVMKNCGAYRCCASGAVTRGGVELYSNGQLTLEGWNLFGSQYNNVALQCNSPSVTLLNCNFAADPAYATYPTLYGVRIGYTSTNLFSPSQGGALTMIGCTMAANAHSTYDIYPSDSDGIQANITAVNCTFGATNEVGSNNLMAAGSFVASARHDQTAGNHKFWIREGVGSIDTTIYSGASPSLRLTPNTVTATRLKSFYGGGEGQTHCGKFNVAAKAGDAMAVSVKVRESVVGDGTDYNGQRIRLMLEGNSLARPDLVTNGGFASATTGWTAQGGATLSSVSGGETGNCLQLQNDGGANNQARQSITTVAGQTYRIRAFVKKGTGALGGAVYVGTTAGASDLYTSGTILSDTWYLVTGTFTATGTTTYLTLHDADTVDGYTVLFDSVSVVTEGDLVLATATSSSEGAWETLSGTAPAATEDCVLLFYVDCGGSGYTTGWVNVDDWANTTKNDTKGLLHWQDGAPFIAGDNSAGGVGGGSFTFVG